MFRENHRKISINLLYLALFLCLFNVAGYPEDSQLLQHSRRDSNSSKHQRGDTNKGHSR